MLTYNIDHNGIVFVIMISEWHQEKRDTNDWRVNGLVWEWVDMTCWIRDESIKENDCYC
jgi:hypothetical protein